MYPPLAAYIDVKHIDINNFWGWGDNLGLLLYYIYAINMATIIR